MICIKNTIMERKMNKEQTENCGSGAGLPIRDTLILVLKSPKPPSPSMNNSTG
jgi:hypothetical protein